MQQYALSLPRVQVPLVETTYCLCCFYSFLLLLFLSACYVLGASF